MFHCDCQFERLARISATVVKTFSTNELSHRIKKLRRPDWKLFFVDLFRNFSHENFISEANETFNVERTIKKTFFIRLC